MLDAFTEAHGIDPRVPPIDILAPNFAAEVARKTSSRAKAAEMENALRHHISISFEKDPAKYKTLSARLEGILTTHHEDWDEIARESQALIDEATARSGGGSTVHGLEPQTEAPIFGILRMRYGKDGRNAELAELSTRVVQHLREESGVSGFWDNAVSQEGARRWIFQHLDNSNIFDFGDLGRNLFGLHGGRKSKSRGVHDMSETIHIDELVFAVKRSAPRKTVSITIERDKSLVAHLPQDMALDDASKLIGTKLVWVHQKLTDQWESRIPEFVDGEGFHFLGKHYRLKLVDVPKNATGVPSVRFEGDRLLLLREQAASGAKRIAEYYTRAAHLYLNDTVQRWKRIVGVEPSRFVQVMDLGFRWASCSADGTLNFHWRVMQLPPTMIEYIVVHELVHIKIPNYSESFWKQLGSVMPDLENRRAWLKKKGGKL